MRTYIRRLLPIGSIVILKKTTKKIMIIANNLVSEVDGKNTHYDYSACLWPEGVYDTNKSFLFNDSDIKTIVNYGLITDEDFRIRLLVQNFGDNIELPFVNDEEKKVIQEEIEILDETPIE